MAMLVHLDRLKKPVVSVQDFGGAAPYTHLYWHWDEACGEDREGPGSAIVPKYLAARQATDRGAANEPHLVPASPVRLGSG